VAAQKMEPIPAHDVICTGSLVHDWRVAQLTRLGIPRPLAEAVAADVASGRRVGAPRLPAPACLRHRPMKKTVVILAINIAAIRVRRADPAGAQQPVPAAPAQPAQPR
jgi:hypothetical protein